MLLYGEDGKPSITALSSMTDRQKWDWIDQYRHSKDQYVFCVIEKVGGFMPRERSGSEGGGQKGSHMFTFGKSYGMLLGFLTAANIAYIEVIPRTWQKSYGLLRPKEATDTQWKNELKDKALLLFPGTKVTLATADALLMAEYCRRSRS